MTVTRVLSVLSVVWVSCSCLSMPELHSSGTYAEVAFDVGRTFQTVIQEFYNQSKTFDTVSQFIKTPAGQNYYDGYFNVVKTIFPHYVDEVASLAKGAGLTFKQVFSMMISPELRAFIGQNMTDACSDVYLNDEQVVIGHNEDADPLIKDRGFLLHAVILDQNGNVLENFTAYTYPGLLPGNAFSFTGDGKIFTVNALFPELVEANKIPRYFLNRAFLSQVNTQAHFEDLLNGLGVGAAYGFSVNYVDLRNSSGILTNYEVGPQSNAKRSVVTRLTVGKQALSNGDKNGHYYHFNMYDHTSIAQRNDPSSIHRKARADALPVPTNVLGITVILGDTEDGKFPIYRTPRPTDGDATVATAIFVLDSCLLLVYKSNPKTTAFPLLTMNLPTGIMCQNNRNQFDSVNVH